MKLWQKIFAGTLLIFIVAFDVGTYSLVSYAYNFNKNRETESGIREQSVILSSISERISSAENFFPDAPYNEERLSAIIKSLSDYYNEQGVLLALFNESFTVYTDMPYSFTEEELLSLENAQDKNITDRKTDGKRHLLVVSRIPDYPHLTFVYARDISQVDDFRVYVGRVFIIMNAVVLVFLGVSIFILLKYLTRPIAKLKNVTAEIADGAYEKRVSVNRNDELGTLARSFNLMADSVEENMARLTKLTEDKQQFIDNLAHEIKTPMTAILGYAEYLQKAKSTEEERINAANHLLNMTRRLKNLSEKLLELTFLRGENIEFDSVDVKSLTDSLTEMTEPNLTSRNLKLIVLSEIETINGDETLILSMLTNLVENAARASHENGTITVRFYNMEEEYIIEVSDNGCGIEHREIEEITAPFYRTDKSRSREFGGVGLGLSIVSQITDLHGAKLEIESNAGKGTKVKICFTNP